MEELLFTFGGLIIVVVHCNLEVLDLGISHEGLKVEHGESLKQLKLKSLKELESVFGKLHDGDSSNSMLLLCMFVIMVLLELFEDGVKSCTEVYEAESSNETSNDGEEQQGELLSNSVPIFSSSTETPLKKGTEVYMKFG